MPITFCSATELEILPLIEHLKGQYIEHQPWQFTKGDKEVHVLITGVGSYASLYALTKYFQHNQPKICIQAGIAGAFSKSLELGDVVQVIEDQIADLGTETAEGEFVDIFEMGLCHENQPPYTDRKIKALEGITHFLPTVRSISSNTISGTEKSIKFRTERFGADIESMEGASFAYVTRLENIPSFQIRSISNYVEPRDKSSWNIPLAVEKLNQVLIEMLNMM